jgi:hypothetical protein
MHALPGLCTLNIFEYEISLSCRKFKNHHQEPLFGHGNTFDRGRPMGSGMGLFLIGGHLLKILLQNLKGAS